MKYCVHILLVVYYLYNFLLSCVQSSEFSVQKDHGVHELVAVWQMYCGCLILNVHAWFLEKAQGKESIYTCANVRTTEQKLKMKAGNVTE